MTNASAALKRCSNNSNSAPHAPLGDPLLFVHLFQQTKLYHGVLLGAAGVLDDDVGHSPFAADEVGALAVDVERRWEEEEEEEEEEEGGRFDNRRSGGRGRFT